jgi:hypothetical protein
MTYPAQRNVPGASLAILDGGELIIAASGVINAETGVQTTTDSVFQIGSITRHRLIAHNGGTIGQYSYLYALPDRDAAVCLLTNGGKAEQLFQDLSTEIFGARWQITPPVRPEPAASLIAVEPSRYVGRYEREGLRLRSARLRPTRQG